MKEDQKKNKAEINAKADMASDLFWLEHNLHKFLDGQISKGLVTQFKMGLLVQARLLLALSEHSSNNIHKFQAMDE